MVRAQRNSPWHCQSSSPYHKQIDRGEVLFAANCQLCHGQSAIGGLKDLRYMTAEQVEDIHAYVISRAQEGWQGNFMQ